MKNKTEKKLEEITNSLTKRKALSLKIDSEFDLLRKAIQGYFEEAAIKIKKASENNDDN